MAETCEIAAIFIDIEDSTGIANHYLTDEYRDFLALYHNVVKEVVGQEEWRELWEPFHHKFFGDEFVAFLPHKHFGERSVTFALNLATKLKLAWYLAKENNERLRSDKEIIELNVGINFGTVSRMEYPLPGSSKGASDRITLEGFPITIAKRAQAVTDQARASRIILADAAYRQYLREKPSPHEFYYLGRSQMKGLAQAISCYEWLGEDLHVEVGKLDASSVEIEPILVSLHEKNPHNPWYASLLANLYFHRGERIWGKIPRDDKWYRKAATVCLEAVHQIRWSHLRPLHGLLLTCLDVQESWQELGFRAEQAYGEDQTFALAHALRARALFLGSDGNSPSSEHVIKAAEQQAERTITLFKDPHDDETHEALFIANLVSAACNAERKQERPALKALEHAVQHAKSANLWWARAELQTLQTKHFEPLFGEDRRWRKIMTQLDSLAKAQGDGQVRHSKRRRTSHPAVNKNRSFRVRGKRNA